MNNYKKINYNIIYNQCYAKKLLTMDLDIFIIEMKRLWNVFYNQESDLVKWYMWYKDQEYMFYEQEINTWLIYISKINDENIKIISNILFNLYWQLLTKLTIFKLNNEHKDEIDWIIYNWIYNWVKSINLDRLNNMSIREYLISMTLNLIKSKYTYNNNDKLNNSILYEYDTISENDWYSIFDNIHSKIEYTENNELSKSFYKILLVNEKQIYSKIFKLLEDWVSQRWIWRILKLSAENIRHHLWYIKKLLNIHLKNEWYYE